MSISVNNLSKVYGNQKAVNDITFAASPGQILGFLGPNGAGKTTTMKMLTCYIPPSSGTAQVCGYDVMDQSMEVRSRIGYLPEHNPLYDHMYVREYLNFVRGLHGMKGNKRIDELIEMTGLGREQHKLISALSKGFRQRVGLAQAMFHDPEVLILDEPTSGLDMNQLQDIRKLIRELGQKKTVIFSTHIMQEVQALCDRVLIINRGSLVADDTIEELQSKIAGEDIIELELLNPITDTSTFEKIEGVIRAQMVGRYLTVNCENKSDVRPALFNHCVKNNYTLIGMRRTKANVETIFQQLTKDESIHG